MGERRRGDGGRFSPSQSILIGPAHGVMGTGFPGWILGGLAHHAADPVQAGLEIERDLEVDPGMLAFGQGQGLEAVPTGAAEQAT